MKISVVCLAALAASHTDAFSGTGNDCSAPLNVCQQEQSGAMRKPLLAERCAGLRSTLDCVRSLTRQDCSGQSMLKSMLSSVESNYESMCNANTAISGSTCDKSYTQKISSCMPAISSATSPDEVCSAMTSAVQCLQSLEKCDLYQGMMNSAMQSAQAYMNQACSAGSSSSTCDVQKISSCMTGSSSPTTQLTQDEVCTAVTASVQCLKSLVNCGPSQGTVDQAIQNAQQTMATVCRGGTSIGGDTCDYQTCQGIADVIQSFGTISDANLQQVCSLVERGRECFESLYDCGPKEAVVDGIKEQLLTRFGSLISKCSGAVSPEDPRQGGFDPFQALEQIKDQLGSDCDLTTLPKCLRQQTSGEMSGMMDICGAVNKQKTCFTTAKCDYVKYTEHFAKIAPGGSGEMAMHVLKMCNADASGGCAMSGAMQCVMQVGQAAAQMGPLASPSTTEGGFVDLSATKSAVCGFFNPFQQCLASKNCSLKQGIEIIKVFMSAYGNMASSMGGEVTASPENGEDSFGLGTSVMGGIEGQLDVVGTVCDSSCNLDGFQTCLKTAVGNPSTATNTGGETQEHFCKSVSSKAERMLTCAKSSGCGGIAKHEIDNLMNVTRIRCGKTAGRETPPTACTTNINMDNLSCEEAETISTCWMGVDAGTYGSAALEKCEEFVRYKECSNFQCPRPKDGEIKGAPEATTIDETILNEANEAKEDADAKMDKNPSVKDVTDGASSNTVFFVTAFVTASFMYATVY